MKSIFFSVALTAAIFAGSPLTGQSCHDGCDDALCDVPGACDDAGDSACDAMGGCAASGCRPCSFCTRPTLTGDWGGLRTCLQESGISFAGRMAHYGFGIDGGINQQPVVPILPLSLGDTFKYTGRAEYDFNFDLEKFGGLPFGRLLVRAEHWFGEYGNVSLRTGAFTPAVFPALLPTVDQGQGVPYITNFLLTQPLSERFVLIAGKSDVLGAADQDIFAGGDGTYQFVNQALIANPAFLLALPYSGFTLGFASPQDWGGFGAFIWDPKDRTQDFFNLGDLFAKGIIVGGQVQVDTNFFCKPGEHHVGALWKHLKLTDLEFAEPEPSSYPYEPVPGFATKSDSYTIYYGFDQYVKVYPGVRPSPLPKKPRKGWGVFGRASISDANPTPIQYFLSLGLGGNSPIRTAQGDTFGVGWYYVGASNEFGPLPQAIFGPTDGTGIEMFHNFQVTPWLNITPDLQYIRPGNRAVANDAIVYGVRLTMRL